MALRFRSVCLDGNDVAAGQGVEPLDRIAVVIKTAADEVGEECARVAARGHYRLHSAVLFRQVSEEGGSGSLRSVVHHPCLTAGTSWNSAHRAYFSTRMLHLSPHRPQD